MDSASASGSSYTSVLPPNPPPISAGVARMFSYNAETAALLPLTVAQAAHGNYTPLMGQAQILAGSLDSAMNAGMQLSVICAEDADLLQPNAAAAGTILGGEIVDAIRAECAVWPHGTRDPALG